MEGVYFIVREMDNIKCRNLVIFSFKIKMKHKCSLSINQIQWKDLNIINILFYCLNTSSVWLLVEYITILMSTAFWGVALRKQCLLERGAYFIAESQRCGTYQRKFDIHICQLDGLQICWIWALLQMFFYEFPEKFQNSFFQKMQLAQWFWFRVIIP